MNNIIILLSTYNGERFLAQQLDSLLNQSYPHWELFIRDDGSRDGTLKIINQYIEKDKRIRLIPDTLGNLGASNSFAALLSEAKKQNHPYIMICDQDDVWLPQKIESSLKKIQEIEEGCCHSNNLGTARRAPTNSQPTCTGTACRAPAASEATPILAHTDLAVVDENLKTLHPSFLKKHRRKGIYPDPLSVLLVQNFVTGCTMIFNRALLNLATPVPEKVFMYDWWIALVAAAFGEIGFIETPMVLYRQHAANVIGSKNVFSRLFNFIKTLKRRIIFTTQQAAALLQLEGNLSPTARARIEAYANIFSLGRFERIKFFLKMDLPMPIFKKGAFLLLALGGMNQRTAGRGLRPRQLIKN